MTYILLIHGAWHDGDCFAALARALAARGHRALCPDLPGAPATGLAECVAALPGAPVVLGHSMGGMVAEALAQARPPRLLIHLCSYLPLPGDSLAALDRLLPSPARSWPRDAESRLILPPKAARAMLYSDLPEDLATAALARLRPQPLGPMRDPLPGPDRASVRRHYILCGQDRAIPPALQRAMIARAPVEHLHETPWGHSPFLSDPEGLAALLDRIIRAEGLHPAHP
ncbi:alpha/beta hydrolase [Paracoccus gahaiensis]|uniref:Alpha/beta hydrolase n=1 Tax=Paracoccus gahaiensis TaxID=1706839 RepID=A0A4U0RGY5_9RHOB|nr:alpha/beta hydrolase [Paracoccus gahaiensis]TJZ94052.1 alpha/beta hydrolase [Paracoccus gahaiensis]